LEQISSAERVICYGILMPKDNVVKGVLYVKVRDMRGDRIDLEGLHRTSHEIANKYARASLRPGDLLLSIRGTYGRVAVVPPELDGANITQDTARLAILPQLASLYVAYWLRAESSQQYFKRVARGVAVKGVNIGDIRPMPVPIAPLPEQHRIVEKIEELLSDLDAGVASLQRAKANLKRYRASVLKSAVEGRLTEEWRKEHPQVEDGEMLLDRILRERREKWEKDQLLKFKEKGKEPPKNWQSKYEEPTHEVGLYDLPSSWVWASALEVCERVENGNTPPPDEMTSGSGDVPFIKVYNLTRDGRLDFTVNPTFVSQKTHEERLGRSRVLPNDVLMNIVGPPLGKVSVVPDTYPAWNMNQAIVLFRASGVVLSRYLAICLMSDEVLRWITRTAKATAGQFNISVGNSRLLPIPLPPLAEQEQIVALVEERLSQIDSAEKTIDAELIRSKRLRQSILKRAFEGKLVPQDPKDEPANVLLERIKASRDADQPKKKSKKATKVKAK
jgi:type I restriction enzyme S subunit